MLRCTQSVKEAKRPDAASTRDDAMHDLVIRNARVLDGLGNDPVEGSIGVKDGRIAEVGDDVGAGHETVDAQGLALAPGIVDIHTHFDAQLTWDPWATPSVALGVTTVVMGNCGFTIAPCRERDRDRTLRNLTHVEGMSLEALLAGVDWDFETYPQYLDMLERKGMVPNVASFVGHSSVRTWALGEEASDRAATEAEVAQMKRLVIEAMEAGAIGFATSTLEQHNGEAGIPMPSRLADEHEMRELTGALGEVGRGVFMLTKGMTSTIPWLESIAANNGRPVNIAAMFIDPNDPERVFREISEIGEARGRGRELWAQVGCFPLGMEFQLRHPYPLEAFLAWQPAILTDGSEAFLEVLRRPEFRAALKAEARTATVPNRFSYHSFETLTVMETTCDKHSAYAGRRAADMAREQGKDPFDWLLDFALDDGLDALLDCKLYQHRRGQGEGPAAPPARHARALRRRRASVVPVRCRLRAAPARALVPRTWRHRAAEGRRVGNQPSRRRVPHQGSRAARAGCVRGSSAVRSGHGGPRREGSGSGPAGRRDPGAYPGAGGPRGLGQRYAGGRRCGSDRGLRNAGESAARLFALIVGRLI